MSMRVGIIAPGNMGAAVGGRLAASGLEVRTALAGRSAASAARATAFGLRPGSDAETVDVDILLSIVPPAQALPLAERLSPLLRQCRSKPLYVDCNAVSPQTVTRIAEMVAATGTPFVDAGIIGLPPEPGGKGPVFYVSGEEAHRVAVLGQHGLDVRVLHGAVGAASALKMAYAGITKGLIALGTASALAASRAGVAEELHRQLAESQPALLAWLTRSVPGMFAKAYRWVAEMEEIADFADEHAGGAKRLYQGTAQLFGEVARDVASTGERAAAVRSFIEHKD